MSTNYCACTTCAMAKFSKIANFSEEDLELYKNSCCCTSYNQGENIFTQFSKSEGIYCMQSGHVMLWHMDALGDEIGFRVIGAEDMFGYRSYFGDDDHAATAVALTNSVVCLLEKEVISNLIDKYSVLSKLFLRMIALDRGPPDSLLLRNTYLPVKVRIINLLLILKRLFARENGDGSLVFELPLYRKDISTMIAARTETVTRAMKELEHEGVAQFSGRTVTVQDYEQLKKAAIDMALSSERGHR